MSTLADIEVPPDDEFYLFLTMKLRLAEAARRRSNWAGGRLYNHFAGDNPDYVELSGSHIAKVFDLNSDTLPRKVETATIYGLRIDIVEKALRALDDI